MPYQAGSRLPGEKASKLGHLSIVKSPFIRALVDQFEFPQKIDEDPCDTKWTEFDPASAKPLTVIAAVDGPESCTQLYDAIVPSGSEEALPSNDALLVGKVIV